MKMESNSSRVSPSNSWTTTFKSQSSWCRIIVVGDLHGHFSVRLPSARPLINRVVQYIKSSTGYKMLLQMLHQNGTTGSKWYMHHLYGTSPIPFSGSFGRTWCISSRSMENLKLAPVALSRRLGIFSLEDDTWWHCAGCVRIGNMWLAKLWGDFHATRIYQDLPGSILLSSGISSTGISLIAAWISQIFGWKMEGCEDRGEPRHGVPKCSWPSTAWRFGVAWRNASKNNTFRGWGVEGVEVSCTSLPHILSSGWLGVNSVCFTRSSVIIYILYVHIYVLCYIHGY